MILSILKQVQRLLKGKIKTNYNIRNMYLKVNENIILYIIYLTIFFFKDVIITAIQLSENKSTNILYLC